MEQGLDEEIKDRLTKVCLCKSISRDSIKKAIKNCLKLLWVRL